MPLQRQVGVVDHPVVDDQFIDMVPSDSEVWAEELLRRLERVARDASTGAESAGDTPEGVSADILPKHRRRKRRHRSF